MKNYKYLLFCTLLGLQACATSKQPNISLPDYLKQFIGQSANTIQQQLDLKPLGFQTLARPVKQNNIAQSTELGAQNIPIQSAGNAGSAYDLNLKCHIIFELDQQQIARSIRYEGKAC